MIQSETHPARTRAFSKFVLRVDTDFLCLRQIAFEDDGSNRSSVLEIRYEFNEVCLLPYGMTRLSSCDLYANNDVKRQRKRYLSPIKKQEARYGRNKQLFAKILLRTRPCMQAMQHRRQIIMMIKAEHVKEEIHGSFDNAENKWD